MHFEEDKKKSIAELGRDKELRQRALDWLKDVSRKNYSYHFNWLGRPIIQFPQDIIASQEIVWNTRPDLIIETGIARGGSLILWASLLEMMGVEGRVIGIDIDIREHNRTAIEAHPLFRRINMLEGSSVDEGIAAKVKEIASGHKRVMVVLDSMHTHEHVLKELQLYAPMVTAGCYLLVFDTIIEFLPDGYFPDRPWGRGNNPYTALQEYLKTCDRFELDREMEDKLLITVAPGGYMKCIKE